MLQSTLSMHLRMLALPTLGRMVLEVYGTAHHCDTDERLAISRFKLTH